MKLWELSGLHLGRIALGGFGEYSNDEAYYNALYPDGYNGSYNQRSKGY